MTRRSNLPTVVATVLLAGGLSACAGTGPPDDVSAAYDGTYTGTSTTEAGACKDYDITMTVTDGAIDGTASGGPYRVDISGYVREGGRVKGSFRSSGASVGDLDGRIRNQTLQGDWQITIGGSCRGTLDLKRAD